MLLFEIVMPLLSMAAEVPWEKIALTGRFDPAEVIALPVTVFPSLPVVVPVEKKTVPRVMLVVDPWIVQFRTVLFVASAMKRIVEVLVKALVLALEIVNEFPPALRPSIVTLSAPFKSISGPAT